MTDWISVFQPCFDWALTQPTWVWVSVITSTCIIAFKIQYEWTYGVWKRMGIPGPTPLPIFGTNHYLVFAKDGHQLELDWAKQYGQKGYYG